MQSNARQYDSSPITITNRGTRIREPFPWRPCHDETFLDKAERQAVDFLTYLLYRVNRSPVKFSLPLCSIFPGP